MESYPTWIRLHPVASDPSLLAAVEARLHDPLWLLGRQWQMGELTHDAGATPIDVRVEGTASPLTVLRNRSGVTVPLAIGESPLEAIAEREAVPESGLFNLELRAQSGLHFARLMHAASLDASGWIDRAPFQVAGELDDATEAFMRRVSGRVADGARLKVRVAAALDGSDGTITVSSAEREVLAAWLAWHGQRFEQATSARTWDPERLEHSFSVAGPGAGREVVLDAPEHVEDRLDWFTFEGGTGAHTPLGTAESRRHFRLPAPLDFAGMPNPRFWTFEDPSVRLDALDLLEDPAKPPSPATAMVLDFALGYSDDWFLVPIPLSGWTVFEASRVVITDCFQDAMEAHRPAGRWNMFRLEDANAPDGLSPFFLHAPATGAAEGEPLEETHFLRDEVANVAWAVERVVPHSLGYGAEQEVREPPERAQEGGGLTWTLAPAAPPASWFPLIPQSVGRLRLGVTWSAPHARPRGEVLSELAEPGRRLHQEEVPPSGIEVTRRWHAARAANGALRFWIGRAKTPRRVQVAPGVRFDLVEWK